MPRQRLPDLEGKSPTTRRDMLRYGGVLGGGLAVMSVGGCIGADDPDDDDDAVAPDDDDPDPTDDPEPGEAVTLPVQVISPDFFPQFHEYGLMCAEAWEGLGAEVDVDVWSWERTASQVFVEHEGWHVFGVSWGPRAERIDPDFFIFSLFHSSNTGRGGQNITEYENPELDEVAEAQRREFDHDRRVELVHQAQEILMEDQPVTPMVYEETMYARSTTRIAEIPADMIGMGLRSYWAGIGAVPKDGVDRYITSYPSEIANLNPLDEPDTPTMLIQRFLWDRLVQIDDDGTPIPWAATGWEVVDDTTIDVEIRDGMTFHDGEDVTVDDVKFSFEYMDEYSPIFRPATEVVDTVEITGDLSLRFTLREPDATFPAHGLGRVYILPEHIWGEIPEAVEVDDPFDYRPDEPIGSGPLQFEMWERDEEMRFAAFDDHWETPEYDYFIRVPGADVPTLGRLLEEDTIDTINGPLPVDIARRLDEFDHIELVFTDNHGMDAMHYHTNVAPLDDKAFRHALAHATPKQDIIDVVYDGVAHLGHSVLGPFLEPWYNPNVPEFGDDLEAARRVLEDAGYWWDDDDVLHYPN